jgi:hypothetical protein
VKLGLLVSRFYSGSNDESASEVEVELAEASLRNKEGSWSPRWIVCDSFSLLDYTFFTVYLIRQQETSIGLDYKLSLELSSIP